MLLIQTALVMVAFAANSLLCRAALINGNIDAGSFTLIRLLSGALALVVLYTASQKRTQTPFLLNPSRRSIFSGLSLFGYAALFSYAYTQLSTGTGALLLFGAVQLTLFGLAIVKKQRFTKVELVGMLMSFTGFVWLVLPSAEQPPLIAASMMIMSGICWAVFTRLGQSAPSAQFAVSQGFIYATILVLPLSLLIVEVQHFSLYGVLLAVISGAITSGLGYFCWYQILPKLSLTQVSVSQLSVPAIAMGMGALFLGENLTIRTLGLTAMILFGIALTFFKPKSL